MLSGGGETRGGRTNKDDYYGQIAKGEIPGVAGKDYPVNSVQALAGRFSGIQVAPADLITPDYPGRGSSSNNRGEIRSIRLINSAESLAVWIA